MGKIISLRATKSLKNMLNYQGMASLINQIRKTYQMAGAKEGKTVLGNAASLSWLQAVTYILPIIILPYLFRVLGAEKFGLIAFAQAFIQYFLILTDYGFNATATKEISLGYANPQSISKTFSSVMTTKMLLALAGLGLLLGIVFCVPKFSNDWPVYVLGCGVILGNTFFPLWFFQGTEKMQYIAKTNIFGGIAYALCIFLFVHDSKDFLAVPIITSAVSLITGFWGQYYVCKEFQVPFKLAPWKEVKKQLKSGWDVFISVLAVNAYTTTRVFAVGLLTNNTLTGYYSIAERIANAVQTFPLSSFSQAIFPRLSKIYNKNRTKAFELMEQIQWITVRISLICLPIIFALSHWIVRLVCGDDYPATVLSLRFLIISVLFVASNAFRVQFLLVCGKTKEYSRIHLTMALIGLPLIIWLIALNSYVGAAYATAMIEAGIFMMTSITIHKIKKRILSLLFIFLCLGLSYASAKNVGLTLQDKIISIQKELNLSEEQTKAVLPIILKYANRRYQFVQEQKVGIVHNSSRIKTGLSKLRKEENEELSQVLTSEQMRKRIAKQNLKDSLNQEEVISFEDQNNDVTITPQGGSMSF